MRARGALVTIAAAGAAIIAAVPAAGDEFSGVESLLSSDREEDGAGEAVELSDEEKAVARRHFESGGERYKEGEYREAIMHFEEAYDLTHAPELLYNIGKCHEELGEEAAARENYEMYLRMKPDAEDADEVRARMDRLGGETGEEEGSEGEEGEGEEREGRGIPRGVRLQLDLGLSVPLGGEWDRKALPLDLMFHFPVAGWLYIVAGVVLGAFVGEEGALNGFPEGEFGFNAGLVGAWNVSDRITLMARLGFVPTWIFRSHQHENAIWLDIQGAVGMAVRLVGSWALTADIVGGFGPVFVPSARTGDLWTNGGVKPSADIGGRIGVLYTF